MLRLFRHFDGSSDKILFSFNSILYHLNRIETSLWHNSALFFCEINSYNFIANVFVNILMKIYLCRNYCHHFARRCYASARHGMVWYSRV